VQQPGERLREQGLAGARGADEQDVGLLQLDVGARLLRVLDPTVVVVDRDRELALGLVLADDVLGEELVDLPRLRQGGLVLLLEELVLGDDVEADVDAFVADEDRGAGDEFLDLTLALVAERAPQGVVAGLFLGQVTYLGSGTRGEL
jgi:hypothetical protein